MSFYKDNNYVKKFRMGFDAYGDDKVKLFIDYIKKYKTVEQAAEKGEILSHLAEELSELPAVGNIRSKGMMMGIELVEDKKTKMHFDPSKKMALKIAKNAFEEGIIYRPGYGFINGLYGDLLIISPPVLTTTEEMRIIVDSLRKNIVKYCR